MPTSSTWRTRCCRPCAASSKFAGPDPERAVVEPEARAVLREFDERVSHYEVVQ